MARRESLPLDIRTAVEEGTPINLDGLRDAAVQVTGTFVAEIQIEGTINGTDFFNLGTSFTGPGVLELPNYVTRMRANTKSYTSGTPTGTVGGLNTRAT